MNIPAALSSEAGQIQLMIRAALMGVRTAIPVKVVTVHPGEGSPPTIGTVDVQPLVETVDGSGKLWELGQVYGAPFLRLQAGGNAVVLDPRAGDIGIAIACDRDISSVLASDGQLSGPGSARTHDFSDLIYLGSILSAAAVTQYIALSSEIEIVAPAVEITSDVGVSGSLSVGTGASGTFSTPQGQVVTVQDGIITNIF